MDPLGEQVELLDPVDRHDHLAVEHEPLRGQCEDELDDLGEVAVHRTAVAALQLDVVAVPEHDRAKAVPLGLVAPALALGQVAGGLGELGLHGWGQRKGQDRHVSGAARRPARGSASA